MRAPPARGREEARSSIERYRDYHTLQDGYVIANPEANEPQFHFNNKANLQEAERHFDPTRPSSLLYFQTPTQRYKLEGVMFTVPPIASEDELNARIPRSALCGGTSTSTSALRRPTR